MQHAKQRNVYKRACQLFVLLVCVPGCFYRNTPHSQEEIIETYERELERVVNEYGQDHLEVVSEMITLASTYAEFERFDEAESLYRKVLEIYERELESDDPRIGGSLYDLAWFYHRRGMYDNAELFFLQGLEIHERGYQSGNGPFFADRIMNVVTHYIEREKYEQAEPFCQRAISLYEAELGEHCDELRKPLRLLAQLYQATGRENEAVMLEQRIAEIGTHQGR